MSDSFTTVGYRREAPDLTDLTAQVASHEERQNAAEARAVEWDAPLHWLKKNWQTAVGLILLNAVVTGVMIHFFR